MATAREIQVRKPFSVFSCGNLTTVSHHLILTVGPIEENGVQRFHWSFDPQQGLNGPVLSAHGQRGVYMKPVLLSGDSWRFNARS